MTKKKQYDMEKKIRELYRADSNNTDTYSEFKSKLKKVKYGF